MTALVEHGSVDLATLRLSLRRRLDEFARRVRARLMLEAASRWIALAAGLAVLTFALDRTLRLSHVTRQGLLVAYIAILIAQAWRWLVRPLRLRLTPEILAAALERKTGQAISARVATVLELPSDVRSSHPMIERAVAASHEQLAGVSFEAQLDDRRNKIAAGSIGATLLLAIALVVAFPESSRLWAARFFAGSDEPWPQRTYLQMAGVVDGVMIVPRGEPFALRVSARANSAPPGAVTIRWREGRSARVSASLTKFGEDDFRYDFPAVQNETVAQVSGGDDAPPPFVIRPVDRPRIVNLALLTQHPTEAQPRAHTFTSSDAGELSFLPLTKMELRFTANAPIAEARVRSATTQPSGDDLHRIDDRTFALRWTHATAAQLQIELISKEVSLASVPTSISIGLVTDKPPRASLTFSGVRQRVTPVATIPLVAEARDDFGVNQIDLNVKAERIDAADPRRSRTTTSSNAIYGPATQPTLETDARQPRRLELSAMNLEPGHLVSIAAVASDNCYTGAQSASSRQITFRVVRPEELFREILLRQQSERAKFRKQLDESRALRQDLNGVAARDAVAQLARRHRAVQRESSRVAAALAESLAEMRLNQLGTPEAYDLLEKNVLARLKSLDADLMEPQKDALDALMPGDSDALANAVSREDQIIDRMSEILKQMSQWDSFVDVLNQLNEIIRVQDQAQRGTDQLKRSQREGVFDR